MPPAPKMPPMPRVALLIEAQLAFSRRLLLGIERYVRGHRPWSFVVEPWDREGLRAASHTAGADGVIVQVSDARDTALACGAGLPCVNVGHYHPSDGFPAVVPDERALGRTGAGHFLERGFRHLAFVGWPSTPNSDGRYAGFAAAAAEAGRPCPQYPRPGALYREPWAIQLRALGEWVAGLPRPLGVLAVNDMAGRHVTEACQMCGLHVPLDVSVLGVDDDEIYCRLSHPQLSSIPSGAERIGYLAAEMLDRMMAGEAVPPGAQVVPPPGTVVTRQSTDITVLEDREVAAAAQFIRDHLAEGVTVARVLDAVAMSRRTAERRFRAALGRSPHDEIRRATVARLKELLADRDLKMSRVAAAVGIPHLRTMSTLFKKETGMTPSAYREQCRFGDAG